MASTFTLYWTSGDRQHDMLMGDFASEEEALAAVEAAKAELLGLCTEEAQRLNIESGFFEAKAVRT